MLNCRLCGLPNPLVKSHSIPNSYFKQIFRKNNGKGVLLTSHDIPDHKATESGDWELLCRNCEHEINTGCEKYSINRFRFKKNAEETPHSIRFNDIQCDKIIRFCISILWRASISPAILFRNFKLNPQLESAFKNYLKNNSNDIDENLFSIYIYKVQDPINGSNRVDDSLVLAPVTHNTTDHAIHKFILEGFQFNISTPSLRHKHRTGKNLIKSNNDFLITSKQPLLKDTYLAQFFAVNILRERQKLGLYIDPSES